MYKITVNGRAHKFETMELAIKAAGKIFERTGVIVGIEASDG